VSGGLSFSTFVYSVEYTNHLLVDRRAIHLRSKRQLWFTVGPSETSIRLRNQNNMYGRTRKSAFTYSARYFLPVGVQYPFVSESPGEHVVYPPILCERPPCVGPSVYARFEAS